MAKGRKPKSSERRAQDGNPGKRPINENEPEPEVLERLPSIPALLKPFPIAKKEWKREGKILLDMGIFTVAEVGNLQMRCFLYAQICAMAERNDAAELTKLKNMIGEYRQLGSLLGLDQPSRARFKTTKPKSKRGFRKKKQK